MPSSLMLLSSLQNGGNSSTANRLHEYLKTHGITCHVCDPATFMTSADLHRYVKLHQIQCVLGIHLYKSGCLLKDCRIPYIIIIGGTDVNEYYTNLKALQIMSDVVYEARYLIVFGDSLRTRLQHLWPQTETEKIVEIKQAVITNPSTFCLYTYLKSMLYIDVSKNNCDIKLFMLVGGIRRVKDPLYLVKAVSDWHREDEGIYFIIIGPKLEEEYFSEFSSTIKGLPGVVYIDGLPPSDTHAAIQQASILVNSSKSEGMSLAILEAMQLGTPVMARSIAGNEDLIKHEKTGFLFHSPEEFIKHSKYLMSSPQKRQEIIANARAYVTRHHSSVKEEDSYLSLITNCLKNDCDGCGI